MLCTKTPLNNKSDKKSDEIILNFPKFEDNKVSTKTIIAVTNLSIDIRKLYEHFPITPYHVQPKKRGRKKKTDIAEEIFTVKNGSIITAKIENDLRGVDLKKKTRAKKKSNKYFRNSLTVVIVIHDKLLNFKVSRNGKFQITGCKTDEHAEMCMKFCWEYMKTGVNEVFTFTRGSNFEVSFIPAMRNIDFDLGFLVDREKLSRYINVMTEYYSMLEASFGYTGCNVKMPFCEDLNTLKVLTLSYIDDTWVSGIEPYTKHLEYISDKERVKKLTKQRFVTLLIFHSGRIICSAMTEESTRIVYYKFLDIIKKCYSEVMEKIDS